MPDRCVIRDLTGDFLLAYSPRHLLSPDLSGPVPKKENVQLMSRPQQLQRRLPSLLALPARVLPGNAGLERVLPGRCPGAAAD